MLADACAEDGSMAVQLSLHADARDLRSIRVAQDAHLSSLAKTRLVRSSVWEDTVVWSYVGTGETLHRVREFVGDHPGPVCEMTRSEYVQSLEEDGALVAEMVHACGVCVERQVDTRRYAEGGSSSDSGAEGWSLTAALRLQAAPSPFESVHGWSR